MSKKKPQYRLKSLSERVYPESIKEAEDFQIFFGEDISWDQKYNMILEYPDEDEVIKNILFGEPAIELEKSYKATVTVPLFGVKHWDYEE